MNHNELLTVALMVAAVLACGIVWSLQPTCGPGEVRVRGFFMTACVVGR